MGSTGRLLHPLTSFRTPTQSLLSPGTPLPVRRRNSPHCRRFPTLVTSVLKSLPPVSGLAEDDILQTFIKERESSGDIVAKVSDLIWLRRDIGLEDVEEDGARQSEEILVDENEGGFLKLTQTLEWVSGDNTAPVNKKRTAKELQDDRDRRTMLNILRYEALKREIMLLTVGIGTACTGYCLVVLSVQAAVSYATGVLFSCLYLQLLYKHVDNLSAEMVPQIFRQKKIKKIGIRSQDLKDSFEKFIQGSGVALSSPRIVLPAAIYAVWGLSRQFLGDSFDFQLLPAMIGVFAYKAAALVQVYRDNEDLQFIFPED